MKGWVRQLTMILLVVSTSVLVESHTKASAATKGSSEAMLADCEWGHILCGGEAIDYDAGVHGVGFPGAYIESGNGEGRFGLYCSNGSYTNCTIYSAFYFQGYWFNSFTYGVPNGARHIWMNGNGNLQVFNSNFSTVLWQTDSDFGETDAYVNIHDNGCASIWHEDNSSAFWSTCF
jgi:hypothetical protein